MIWETSAVDNERRAPGWRGDVLLSDIDGNVIWQRAINAETTGVHASLAAAGAPMGWFTKPCITADGEKIVLGLDGTVVLLRTNDGTPLAVLPVNGAVNAAGAGPATGALVVATDHGLQEIETNTNPGRALRRFLGSLNRGRRRGATDRGPDDEPGTGSGNRRNSGTPAPRHSTPG